LDAVARRYWIETLGCPKNQVDSDKLAGTFVDEGMAAAADPADADVVVVNTCAFIEPARRESIETILSLATARKPGARLVVTGCLAERYGEELREALPEADAVARFGVPVALGSRRDRGTGRDGGDVPSMDLLNLPRPRSTRPWAYVKVAEGCDRKCGFCAIPSFRGAQRSRDLDAILSEIDALDVREVVLVAQDLASYGRDRTDLGAGSIVTLVEKAVSRVDRVRLLYLYPSELDDRLIDAIEATGIHYFDLSLQHVSRRHLRRMRRWGDGARFLRSIDNIRSRMPDAAFRSNFIVGYPGETEADHDELLRFVEAAQLDWCGFFAFSLEDGTFAASAPPEERVAPDLVAERLAELSELQDGITARKRASLVGSTVEVLVDEPGVGRSHREAPEIDGIIEVPASLAPGTLVDVVVVAAEGPDLQAVAVGDMTAAVPRQVSR
jgi:ribosomal protein S12 methylthiotransferase